MPRRLTPAIQAALLVVVVSYLSSGAGAQAGLPARPGADGSHAAPAFGLSPAEKRALDLITDHPMIPREHLARWLGVSDGRVSQMTRSLTQTWGLVEQHGKRSDVRYTLSERGIGYITRRDRAQLSHHHGRMEHGGPTTDNHGQTPAPGTPHPHLGQADQPR